MPFGQSKTYGFSNEIIPFLIISGEGNGVGVFVYNGTPELGNPPIAWMTNGSLVDPYGNVLPAVMGIAGVGLFSAGQAIISPTGIYFYVGTPGAGNPPVYYWAITGTATDPYGNALPTTGIVAQLSGTAQFAALTQGSIVLGAGAFGVNMEMSNITGIVSMFGNATGFNMEMPFTITSGGISADPDVSLIDNTVLTNANVTGANAATKLWSIPANNANANTTYEIETPFNAVTGTATETIGFKPSLNGAAVATSGGDIIGATALAVSTAYTGEIRLRVVIVTTGVAGTANFFIKGGMALQGNLQGTVDAWFLSSQATNVAFNTTVANTISIDSLWGGNPVGSTQSISNHGSAFTRKGA